MIAYGGELILNHREALLDLDQIDGTLLGSWIAHRDFIRGLNVSSSGHLQRLRKVVQLPCFVLPQLYAHPRHLFNSNGLDWNHRGLRGTQRL